ncbi:MAG: signal peptidase I [Candidatus Limnocylindrales bacterium]
MKHRSLGCLFEVLETLLLTLIVFVLIQLFVAQPYEIQQQSMQSTLMPNQYVLVDKLTPRFDDYHHGDIVVFNPPAGWARDASGTPFIKRVIGVGGDTIDIHDGRVFVNGSQLDEPYVYQGQATLPADPKNHTWKIGDGQLFVMGDHRSDSQDSRAFGPIDKSTVIGRAWLRYWPFDQFGILPPAESPAASTETPAAPTATPTHK